MPDTVDTAGLDVRYLPVLRLWMLRVLLRCNGVRGLIRLSRVHNARIARFLGLSDQECEDADEARVSGILTARLTEAESSGVSIPEEAVLARNVRLLAQRMRLNDVERNILHLSVLGWAHGEFSEVLGYAGLLSRASLNRLFAECLSVSAAEVQAALDDTGKLCRSALLTVDDTRLYSFDSKVDLLRMLPEALMIEHDDLLDILSSCLVRAPEPRLTLADFPHLAEDVSIVRPYLDGACRLRQPGVNILLHGRPGTGKTEFVRALAAELGLTLMEIPTMERCGRPRAGEERFQSFRFAQGLLAGAEGNLLLFDEIEDVFGRHGGETCFASSSGGVKGWVNQILEGNAVPAIWVTNHLDGIDTAYRRRFDLVLRMDVPPVAVRRRLVDRHMGSLAVPEAWRQEVARHESVTPAVMERVAKVGALVCALETELPPQQILTRVMNHTLTAQGAAPLCATSDHFEAGFRVELLSADCDLVRLQAGLQRVRQGRLCLFGPPGTGKTAYGRHLAEALGLPLLVRRASDILSPYTGEAERNIAAMFEQARQAGAILLLDEADSLLRERRGAQRSWEVTQVNEMLTQMEAFQGIFVASTNLMDSLDLAALRRFDTCIRFGYLGPAQAWEMFASLAGRLGLEVPAQMRRRLDQLTVLTPGDFAAIARGARLNAPANAEELLGRLWRACEVKSSRQSRPIGFLAAG